jgi:dTDP-4-dehydrorhamnose 3,5-epimerase
MTLNYAVIYGSIKFVLYDDRNNSSTKKEVQELFISTENYQLVTVPPGIWNGFKGIGTETSIIANCSTVPHTQEEIIRKEYNDNSIPYDWNIKYR